MPLSELEELFYKYYSKTCTQAEKEMLFSIAKDPQRQAELRLILDKAWDEWPVVEEPLDDDSSEHILAAVLTTGRPTPSSTGRHHRIWRPAMMAAASIILVLLAGGLYLILHHSGSFGAQEKQHIAQGKVSSGSQVELTLADGSTIAIDKVGNGQVAQQGAVKVIKSNGQLVYDNSALSGTALLYNAIRTPKGYVYNLVLSDGTKVWLNAASSIRFPTSFSSKERRVEITGELYFEVARDEKRPFVVEIAQPPRPAPGPTDGIREIEVLGTNFNVNAYTDERSVNTTLLEGAVRVRTGSMSRLLAPGQQARMEARTLDVIDNVPIEDVMAWRNGLFNFDNAGIHTIMRQLARWYDVDVRFEGDVSEREFTGKFSRSMGIANVLKILERSDIHFRMEEKKIIVMP